VRKCFLRKTKQYTESGRSLLFDNSIISKWITSMPLNFCKLCALTLLLVGIASLEPAEAIVCLPDFQASNLERRLEADQHAREQLSQSSNTQEAFRNVIGVDADNRFWLMHVLMTCERWPHRSDVGDQAAKAAWMIALHGDMDPTFQEWTAGFMRQAVLQGEAHPRRYAGLVDRTKRNQGEPQEFGTDYEHIEDELQFRPIRSLESVNQRRRELGLSKLECELCRGNAKKAVLANGQLIERDACDRC